MKISSFHKKLFALILLIIVTISCKQSNSDKLSCIYCGKSIPDYKEISIKLNDKNNSEDPFGLKPESQKVQRNLIDINGEICSMKCYSELKKTFYHDNRDSLFVLEKPTKQINFWIFNKE